ncbi:hypothetical protein F183_A10160 [Bryobacterales bacterium F-183]|nr:hypothetical protein F183_A10160 [Bryobacterales bacterium F-183]
MEDNEILRELRQIRDDHAAKFNYNLKAIYGDIKRIEKESGRKFVSFRPRTIESMQTESDSLLQVERVQRIPSRD